MTQISLLVPFRANIGISHHRIVMWRWLRHYWQHELPDAEIIMADSSGEVFSKTAAVNIAARQATGRVFVILDADCYIPGSVIQYCADEIESAQARGNRLWYVPYRSLYRLTKRASERVLDSSPHDPLRFPTPPDDHDVESTAGSMHGKRFGALIQIMPRHAFEMVRGMDERFIGWGGEDISLVRALDTLYIPHKVTPNDVLHLWHAIQGDSHLDRLWPGQLSPRANDHLANRYNLATGDRVRMRNLIEETPVDIQEIEEDLGG